MAEISKKRKVTYYIGLGMIAIGFLLFFSAFFAAATAFKIPFISHDLLFINPTLGMFLIFIGMFVMNIGARGAAGSGLMLDPDKAREDLKPFNEAKGGMLNDVISQIDAVNKFTDNKEVIKIRCQYCRTLNDEDARFCKGCGKEL